MGKIIRRGTKDRPRFYLRYVDADGVRRMKAAKGATKTAEARDMLTAIEKRIMEGTVGSEEALSRGQSQVSQDPARDALVLDN
jgi:hypothetical protein